MDGFLEHFFKKVYRNKKSAHESNYCKYNNQELTAFTSSLYLAGLVASLLASPVTRNYGRRASIIAGGISFFVGAALNASAINMAMLLLGRIMLGVGIGFGNQVPDETLIDRCVGRRLDPVTGKIYHVKSFIPESEEIKEKLVTHI